MAEEYAQSAIRAETRGGMEVASILWGDSWSYDRKAQNYRAEAIRYEQMLPNTAPTPVFTAPGTAPKHRPMSPAKAPKTTTSPSAPPGAATQGELAAGQEKVAWAVP